MPQEWVEIATQVISFIAMALAVFSLQFRSMKAYYTIQTVAATVFTISYIMLGSYASAILNMYGVVRTAILLCDKRKCHCSQLITMVTILALCGVIAISLDGWIALLPLVAQLGSTVGMWTRNGGKMRLLQLTVSSPFWLINNVIVRSGGGIACEIFNVLSVLISIRRYGWKNLLHSDGCACGKGALCHKPTTTSRP